MNEALLGALLALSIAFGVGGMYALRLALTTQSNVRALSISTQNGFDSVAQHVARVEDHVNNVSADLAELEDEMQPTPGQVMPVRVH